MSSADNERGFQPEGLPDSSRWSQRSGDHRRVVGLVSTLKGVPESGTLSGSEIFSLGIRWSTLRCDHRLLSDSLPG
jgi:hypothetical protein